MSDLYTVGCRLNGADVEFFDKASGTTLLAFRASGPTVDLSTATAINLPSASISETMLAASSAIGLGTLRVAHAKYSFAVDGGVTGAITPASTAVIPNKAIIVGGVINPSGAVTSLGSATLAVGTTAGSAANSILTATAKATLSANALVNSVATFAAPVKMSAAGSINVTVGTADLTAGIVEIFALYVVSST